jgi:hypothetical protein
VSEPATHADNFGRGNFREVFLPTINVKDHLSHRYSRKKNIKIIKKREEPILAALDEPISLKDLCSMGLIYGKKFLVDEWVCAWDALTVKKHLDRLLINGMITYSNSKYFNNH